MNSKKDEKKLTKTDIKKWIIKHAPVICISLAAFIALVAVLVMVFQAKQELEQFTVKYDNLYTYILNNRMDFYTEITLNSEDEVTKMTYNGEEITFLTEPIYYNGQKKAIFPDKMSVVFPVANRAQKKINRFTTIESDGIQPVATNIGLSYALTNAFIYDGYDVFFFLEDGTISYGDKNIEISKMSFVRCEYKGALAIYNYERNEMIYEEKVEGNVIATFRNYSIDLSNDLLNVDGKSSLLIRNVDTQQLLSNN